MAWNEVAVIAKTGTQFGVVADRDGGLTLVMRRPGERWPHGVKPISGRNEIRPGYTRYVVCGREPQKRRKKRRESEGAKIRRAAAKLLQETPGGRDALRELKGGGRS